MKNYSLLILSYLLLIFTSCSSQKSAIHETSKPLDNTLLWEVSGNGLQKPSYLFGTFHMMCKEDFIIKDKVRNAMSKTEQSVLEINFSDMSQMMEMQKYMKSEKKLSQTYNPSDLAKLEAGLSKFGYQLSDVDEMSPLMLYSMLTMKFFDCQPSDLKMLDLEIMNLTMAENKKLKGLETVAQQAEIFNSYLTPQELLKLVEDFDKSKADMKKMLQSYLNENLEGVINSMKDTKQMNEEQQKVMLTNRNLNWQKQMPEMMKEKPTFFAVGAAHLVGDYGMIKLLRDLGYTVKPVMQ